METLGHDISAVHPASMPGDRVAGPMGSGQGSDASDSAPRDSHARPADAGLRVARVQKAFEQVADQLRELIVSGKLPLGQRLPSETELARKFGVSRPTIREALRVLAAQNLIRTAKGVHGGSFVTTPSVDHISAFLRSGINLLTEARHVSLEEFLEVREFFEVRAARLAALRRTNEQLQRLRDSIPEHFLELGTQEQFVYNRDFHSIVIASSGNTLLTIAAQPVFSVLQTSLARSSLGQTFHSAINEHHRQITDAIAVGDADGAEDKMRSHLQFLVPYYEKAWRNARRED